MEHWQQFETFAHPGIVHGFSGRWEGVAHGEVAARLEAALGELGVRADQTAIGEQPHGNRVARVETPSRQPVPEVDALVTDQPGLALIVRVADCGPVFFHDPVRGAIGVAHSGRKGTEANITGETVAALRAHFGCDPANLRVQLGPCIRPPHYEVAFADEIGRQARAAGVRDYADCGVCTGANLDRYYSYRREKGQTGRMWGVLMLKR
ncbi:MAG: polyphenol oxidase family protein [Verrucomicrobiota bacterium]